MTLREAQQRAITEWSISRAFREFQNSKAKSFAILTSWRATIDGKPVPAEVNNANWSRFKGEAGSAGHGYVELRGVGQENDATGKVIQVHEPSLWVNGISMSSAQSLADRYGQYAFVYSGPETNGVVTLVASGSHTPLGNFSPSKPLSADDINKYWSDWRGRSFRFIEMAHPVQNSVEGLGYATQINRRARKIMEES